MKRSAREEQDAVEKYDPMDKTAILHNIKKKIMKIDIGNNASECGNEEHNDGQETKEVTSTYVGDDVTTTILDMNEMNPSLKTDSPSSSNLVIDSCSSIDSDAESKTAFEDEKPSNDVNAARAGSTVAKLRQFSSLPIFIVDYHHHVLEFIYRCVGSRHLPVEANMLIHFDSHPDMVISHDIQAKDTYNKSVMQEETSIESWIMPLCYTGIFTRIVWIKNSWCNQLPNGKHIFQIGEHNGKLCVDLALSYFLAEGNYCEFKELSNARSIELFVMDASELDAQCDEPFKFPESIDFFDAKEMPYILDTDLDFFSVNNPFLSLYEKSNCYEQLREIFAFEAACDMEQKQIGWATNINQRRIEKLKALKEIFEYLEDHATLKDFEKSVDTPELDAKSLKLLEKLVNSLKANYKAEEIQWMLVYDAGCTADSGGLPHHNSDTHELKSQYERFKRFAQRLPYPPVAVTVARSAEDNYCPSDQVDDIQEDFLLYLQLGLESKLKSNTIYAYLDEEYNIMEL